MSKRLKAVIPAAGLGTRTLPASKVIAKELLPLGDRPGIQHIMEEIIDAGIKQVGIVISKGKESIIDHFTPNAGLKKFLKKKKKEQFLESIEYIDKNVKITTIYQDEPKGLGHAVLVAKDFVKKDDFMVLLPDDIIFHQQSCTSQMVEIYQRYGKRGVVALEAVPKERVSSYGIVAGTGIGDKVLELDYLVEKPKIEDAPSNLSIVGRYLLPAEIFDILENTSSGAIGEIQLTDALDQLAKRGKMLGYQFVGERVDLGTTAGFLWANICYLKRHQQLLKEIEDRFGQLPF